jgi:hypothetical protein
MIHFIVTLQRTIIQNKCMNMKKIIEIVSTFHTFKFVHDITLQEIPNTD